MFPTVDVSKLVVDLQNFLPEVVLTITLVVLLLLRLFTARMHVGGLALAAVVAALFDACFALTLDSNGDAFARMLVYDNYTVVVRIILLGAALVTIGLTLLTGIPDTEDSGDFYVLLLGGTLGMLFMSSANHLLMAYIAVEMASLPSYALAGFLKGKRRGSEAAAEIRCLRRRRLGRNALRHQPVGRPLRHRLLARPHPRVRVGPTGPTRRWRGHPADPGHTVYSGRVGVQAFGGAVSLLVSGRLRRSRRGGGSLLVRGEQGGGFRPDWAADPGVGPPRRSPSRPADVLWAAAGVPRR